MDIDIVVMVFKAIITLSLKLSQQSSLIECSRHQLETLLLKIQQSPFYIYLYYQRVVNETVLSLMIWGSCISGVAVIGKGH